MANVHVVSCGTSVLGRLLRERAAVPSLVGFAGDKLDALVRYLQFDDGARAGARAAVLDQPDWFAELPRCAATWTAKRST